MTVTAARPLVFDPYERNRTTGSFIVIDPATNSTAGAGMIVQALDEEDGSTAGAPPPSGLRGPRGRPRRGSGD